eukprot:2747457-Karenia_brevis.AAC.1
MGLTVPGWATDAPRWGQHEPRWTMDEPQDGAKMCQDAVLGHGFEASWEPPGSILAGSWRSLGVSWG